MYLHKRYMNVISFICAIFLLRLTWDLVFVLFLDDEDFTKEITELFSQLHVSSKPEKLTKVSYYFLVIFVFLLMSIYRMKNVRF